jgi:LemA protein
VTTLLAVLIVSAVLAVAVLAWFAMAYNGLVRRRNAVANAWSQVDVQLKRRYDLIPNLVETARGYAAHERPTFEAVIAARNAAFAAQGPAEQAKAENALTGTLRSLFALAESYPQLQASRTFADLQAELSDTENRIAYARQYYNDAVLTYNNAVQTVPTTIVAGMAGFAPREHFAAPDEERRPTQVRF